MSHSNQKICHRESYLTKTHSNLQSPPPCFPFSQTTQTQEQKNANPHSAQQHKTQVKPVTPQQTTKQDQKHAKTQDNKQHQSKQQKNATAPTKAVGPTKQTETPKQNQTSKAAPVQQPTKTKSMTPAQQLEMQQILNILIDEDWNDKTNKQPQPTPKQAQKTPKAQAPKPQDAKASKASQKSTTPVQQVPKTALTRKVSMSPAQLQEQKEILHILIDEDWTPPAKKPQTNQKPTTRPGSAKTKQNTPAKTATTQSPPVTQKKAQTHSKLSLSPDQQLEMQQILNILIDDAGKDWKPRNKTVKPHTKQPNQNPSTRPTSAKPRQKTQKATTHSPRPQTSSAATSRPVPKMTLTPAQQVEMQQILNILIGDTGKDWKPRNKKPHDMTKNKKHGAKPTSFTPKQKTPAQKTFPHSTPVAKKNTASKVKAPTKSSVVKPAKPLHRRRSLTDAQKREKRAIMEILLEPYEYVPAPVRPRSSTVQLHAELDHKVGNVVVVSNQAVDASEDLSGFETVKSRRTNFQEKKEFRQEIGDMMSILIDWTEPLPKKQAKQTPKKKTPQKAPTPTKTQTPTKSAAQAKTQPVSKPQTPSKPQDTPKTQNKTTQEAAKPQTPKKAPKSQTAQQQKAPPATTHIQANKNQRAKLTT
ncbi:hypothetical protein AC1031_017987 [Aphanomyces cochlioides]|nr:hypothetical protein AC1031_017984 [Aphanomyces cochlioides]KAG9409957.1 hypothetical protein AC1031_017985 [Aphanomyces cochlioides]KAG9409958.1 hypothetical protein AC1031_017986 [Aphanomyces cochlioides]KAG9409959.1 hypothetical protein AC1031_017987 [Aphanomyces cochlioides]